MGNNCSNCSENLKDEDFKTKQMVPSKDYFEEQDPSNPVSDSAPRFYIVEPEDPPVQVKSRRSIKGPENQGEKNEEEKSNLLEGNYEEALEQLSAVTARSKTRREKLKHSKTMMDEMSEKVEVIPEVHPEKEELELIVTYLKNHFVFGSMSSEALYNFHF